jgi:hypothetical protein
MPSLIKSKSFEDLVSRHLRTVTDNVVLTDEEMATLTEDPVLWWVQLVQLKKAVETQLAAKKAELRIVKRRADLNEIPVTDEMRADRDFAEWRAKSLRFKNVVEQVIAEVAVLVERERTGFFHELVIQERNSLAQELSILTDAVRQLAAHTHSGECVEFCPAEQALFDLVLVEET